jgi:carboxymethylenebutenolidase
LEVFPLSVRLSLGGLFSSLLTAALENDRVTKNQPEERMGEPVTFKSSGGTASGYLARPSRPGPGIVVIQEWWGLVPHIEQVTDRFASEGFVALAPDLYHGKTTKAPDEAGKLMMSLRVEEAARDLAGAVAHVKTFAAPHKVATIGFCMGGALSLFAACRNPDVGACIVFYGVHPNIKPDLTALKAPVLGIFGGDDTTTPPAAVAELDRQLSAAGKRHEFHTYAGAKHAFFNDHRREVYDPKAAADAWNKTLTFLRRELNA